VSGPARALRVCVPGVLGFLVVAATVVLAGCSSVVRVAYNNGDIAVRMMADEYLDLQGEQATLFKARLVRFHEWHRLEELPRYAQVLDSAAARVRRGVTRADVEWAVAAIRERYRVLAMEAIDAAIPVLATLTPQNLVALDKKFAASNRKFADEYLTGTPAAREKARDDAIGARFDEWLGSVSAAQQRLIADYVRMHTGVQAMRLADREARQQELVSLLGREHDASVLRERLRAFFVDYEAQRSAEYARASRDWEERVITLVTDILQAASPAQRDYAAERLTRYADDFRALAEEGRKQLPSGTRAAQEAAHSGTLRIHYRDDREDREDHGASLVRLEEREVDVEHLAEAAGAHEPEHGRHADVVLPAVERVRRELRQHRGHRAVEKCERSGRSGVTERIGGLGRRVLERLGEEPAEHAGRVPGERERSGERAQAGGEHHQRRPYQLRDRAQEIEQQARGGARGESPPSGRGQREEHAEADGEEGPDAGDRERLECPRERAGEECRGEVGRKEAGDEAHHLRETLRARQRAERHAQIPEAHRRRGEESA
jgi:Family of unknown function (DUF6279)